MATADDDAILRNRLEQMLRAGLATEWQERAYTSEAVNAIAQRLRSVSSDDYQSKLRIAGVTDHAYAIAGEDIGQACETCMYLLVHRQFCELPELQIPVKPEWSCRLWRV